MSEPKKTTRGIIVRRRLNRRIGAPSVSADKHPNPFKVGDSVNIVKTYVGDRYKDNDLWYLLDTGEFAWSGCIKKVGDGPSNKKVIFTCDDYGVVDSVNEGILDAAQRGFVNSVAAFTNYGHNGEKSVENLKKLRDLRCKKCDGYLVVDRTDGQVEGCSCGHRVQVGVHLTITSGNPLIHVNNNPFCANKRKWQPGEKENLFYDFTKVPRLDSRADVEILRAEMEAQIQVMRDVGIRPTHLSSHHNALYFYRSFYTEFLRMAQDEGIPIRSRALRPRLQKNAFLAKVKGFQIKDKELNRIYNDVCYKEPAIPSPACLDSTHFGLVTPSMKLERREVDNMIENRHKRMGRLFEDLRNGDEDVWEFVFHLYKGAELKSHNEYLSEVSPFQYAGIDHLSFDNRTVEYMSVTSGRIQKEFNSWGIRWGNWLEI